MYGISCVVDIDLQAREREREERNRAATGQARHIDAAAGSNPPIPSPRQSGSEVSLLEEVIQQGPSWRAGVTRLPRAEPHGQSSALVGASAGPGWEKMSRSRNLVSLSGAANSNQTRSGLVGGGRHAILADRPPDSLTRPSTPVEADEDLVTHVTSRARRWPQCLLSLSLEP
jgi:hypothetical protein